MPDPSPKHSEVSIHRAETDAQIAATFAVMRQLRSHLEAGTYGHKVRSMAADGYRLVYVQQAGAAVTCVAGYHVSESLSWGRFLYVHDLVTDSRARSKGHGKLLLDWLTAEARRLGCGQLHLDSGTQRCAAHRFYLCGRMDIIAFHFFKSLI